MESLRVELEAKGATDSRSLPNKRDGRVVTVAGLVTVRQRPSTAGGTIFLLLEDEWGYINVVVPQPLVEPNEDVVKRARFVKIQGRVDNDGAAVSVIGRKFESIEVEGLSYQSHDFH
jgi:error-prone DNA polymerase